MEQFLKRLWILRSFAAYIPFATAIAFASFPEMQLAIVSQPTDISIVQKGETVTFSFVAEKGDHDISYQWYQSADGTKQAGVIIDNATSSSFTTDAFTNRGIRYYYCIATAGDESVSSDVVVVAYTGLPILRINTEIPIDNISKEEYVLGRMEIIYGNGENFSYEFKKEKNGEKKEGIKGRGNSSWQQPKKGYSIKFENKQSLFGFPASKKWCITGNYSDKTLLRNKLASVLGYEIYNADWNPRFVSVDLVWNGEYRGNYIFGEKVAIGSGRVDIQDISDYSEKNIEFEKYTDQNGDGLINLYDGGFVFEIDQRDDAEFTFITTKDAHIALDDPDSIPDDTWSHIKNVIQTAEDVLYSTNYTNDLEGWRNFYDENSIIDWFFVNEIAKNRDARQYASIYKYYSPAEKKIHFAPIWDFDIGFGNDGEKGDKPQYGNPTGWYIKNGTWMGRFFTDSGFVANVKSRWNSKKNALINAVTNGVQTLANENATSAECNFNKWKILGKYVWPNPEGYKDRQTYQSEIDYMKNWLGERIAWMDNALKNSFFISYDLAGGGLAKNPTKVFISQSTSEFTLRTPTRYGYVFAGWSGPGIDSLSTSVKVTDDGKGDRTFTANWTRDFSIKDISLCTIALSDSEFVYNGSTVMPAVIVTDAGRTLVAGSDYAMSYENNIVAGTAKVIVTGTGEYSGAQEKAFTILPRPIVVKAADNSKMYREVDPELSYSVENIVPNDDIGEILKDVALFRESGENVGEYAITATIDSVVNPNYTASVENALFTIVPDTTQIIVMVTGHIGTAEYNGNEYVVHGFDMETSNNVYSLDFVAYTGDSLVYGSTAKTYPMGLVSKDFKNTSPNYSNVLFDITDGNLVVVPKPIILIAEDASKMYGTNDPEWNWKAEGLLPRDSVKDVLTGIKITREPGENVGRYAITATIDSIANPNYTASVKNGVLAIKPDTTKIVVKVKGHADTVEYDGKKHAVYGFDMLSNNEKYSLDFVAYEGDSLVLGKDAKTYPMGLAAYDFINTSVNFSNVVFDITDGNLVIKPQETKDAIPVMRTDRNRLRLSSTGRLIQVQTSMLGERYAVFDVQGVIVQAGNVENEIFDIPVIKAGVYIVCVGSSMQNVRVR